MKITKSFAFDAAHRLLGHEGKCRFIHGHRYTAKITLEGSRLDGLGRLIDFGEVTNTIGRWINGNWDHNILLHPSDPLFDATSNPIHGTDIFADQIPYTMPRKINPTAEAMAQVMYAESQRLLAGVCPTVSVLSVEIFETPTASATYP
jgi:6-pyruvoyltetrahydropterin/6-carboxytetrahydropterin synthase